MNSSISAQTALLKTVQEIQDRTEVEECLRDMLIDVELSVQLQERLQTHHKIELLRQRIQEQEYVIAELKAVRNATHQYQTKMADTLIEELLTLSIEIGTLKETKQQHEKLLLQYDEVVAKLIQMEESRTTEPTTSNSTAPTSTIPLEDSEPARTLIVLSPQTMEAAKDDKNPLYEQYDEQSMNEAAKEGLSDADILKNDIERVALQPTNSMDESCISEEEPVTLVKEMKFDEFEKEIFLKIFSYLDAIDILNTAQINVSMYSRVDSFFDVGDAAATTPTQQQQQQQQQQSALSSDELPSQQVSNTPTDTATPIKQPQQSTLEAPPTKMQPTVVALPPIETTKIAPSSVATAMKQINDSTLTTPTNTTTTPSLIAIPSLTSPTEFVNLPSLGSPPRRHEPSKSNDSAILNRGIFALLQPRQHRPSTSNVALASSDIASAITSPARSFLHPLTSSTTTASTFGTSSNAAGAGGVGGGSGGPFTLNKAMANSMASKLSDAELNAIILMTERLKQKEAIADTLVKENEILLAKLDGTEGVKQFLINKVRDMEIALSGLIQNETKVVQQIASDQDVIAFLDGRVQELEHTTTKLLNDKDMIQVELDRIQKQTNQKVTVLGDMLQFEREKLMDQEREWKMTKKLLIKEIKNCRAQNTILQSERDGYREQYESLRRSIQQSTSNNSYTAAGSNNSNSYNGISPRNGNSKLQRDRAFAK